MDNPENGRVIHVSFDCDKTLIRGNMPEEPFRQLGIDPGAFFDECNKYRANQKRRGVNIAPAMAYLNQMIRYAHSDTPLQGLSNRQIREWGPMIEPFPGVDEFFLRTKANFRREYGQEVRLEFTILSTGLKDQIQGCSRLQGHDYVYASEFDEEDGVIRYVATAVGHQDKADYLFMVNKGCNAYPTIDVNDEVPYVEKRVKWHHMGHVGDSSPQKTDHAAFATLRHKVDEASGERGFSIVVGDSLDQKALTAARLLYQRGKVTANFTADYREGSDLDKWFNNKLVKIANRIED
jgi:hypothetical protein